MDKISTHHDGLKIGLLGGSFNPPHAAHLEISLRGLNLLGLDFVWWLVSAQNPLKDPALYAPLSQRLETARQLVSHPRIIITSLESRLQTRYTIDTLKSLRERLPSARFVWLMGSDNAAQFHHWRGYATIAHTVPIAVFRRPGAILAPLSSRFAVRFRAHRRPLNAAPTLALHRAPGWIYIPQSNNPLASREIRANLTSSI